MSISWDLMSSRPSSNTANRPIGPAPMMTASVLMISVMVSALPGGGADHQAVERRRHLDLAGQAGGRPHLECEIEHVLFHLRRLADDLAPFRRGIDVAGRASA